MSGISGIRPEGLSARKTPTGFEQYLSAFSAHGINPSDCKQTTNPPAKDFMPTLSTPTSTASANLQSDSLPNYRSLLNLS